MDENLLMLILEDEFKFLDAKHEFSHVSKKLGYAGKNWIGRVT